VPKRKMLRPTGGCTSTSVASCKWLPAGQQATAVGLRGQHKSTTLPASSLHELWQDGHKPFDILCMPTLWANVTKPPRAGLAALCQQHPQAPLHPPSPKSPKCPHSAAPPRREDKFSSFRLTWLFAVPAASQQGEYVPSTLGASTAAGAGKHDCSQYAGCGCNNPARAAAAVPK
jgi:hypothetical protein